MLRLTRRALAIIGYTLLATLLIAQISIAVATYAAEHTGHKFLIVTGGSMEPTYPLGSGIIIKTVNTDDIKPGMPVTFQSVEGTLTTHRVIARHTIDKHDYVQTQGDANPDPDPNFANVDAVIGTPVLKITKGGYAAQFLTSDTGRFVLFVPALLYLILNELRILAGRIRERRNIDKALPSDAGTTVIGIPNLFLAVAIAITLVVSILAGSAFAHSNAVFVSTSDGTDNLFATSGLVPPTNLTGNNTSGTTTLNWTATTSTKATGYTVFRANTTAGPYTQLGTVSGRGTTTYNDTTASQTYVYAVQATVGEWASANSTPVTVNAATVTTVAAPTNVAVTNQGDGVGRVSWTPSTTPGVTGTNVYRSSAAGGPYTLLGTTPASAPAQGYSDDENYGTYYYVVRAVGSDGTLSPASAEVSMTRTEPYTTGFWSCGSQAAGPGGDGNGYETGAATLCEIAGQNAVDNRSGSNTTISCTDAGKDRHDFWGFPLQPHVSSSATVVDYFTINLSVQRSIAATTQLCYQLSSDSGTTWTPPQSVDVTSAVNTYGSYSVQSAFGRTWTPADLASGKFRLRITNVSGDTRQVFTVRNLGIQAWYH